MIRLSDRLQIIADQVRPGEVLADIGTDHGQLPVYLYEEGICPRVILADISEPSLAKAKETAGAGQFGSGISFRVGNGLQVLEPGEADVVVIAGMGGRLIRDILAEDHVKTRSFSRFVFQPRTASGPLRKWLSEAGFSILREDIVREGQFLPEIITASPGENEGRGAESGVWRPLAAPKSLDPDLGEDSIRFAVPPWIVEASGPVDEFLDRKTGEQRKILAGLCQAVDPDEEAIRVTEENIEYLEGLKGRYLRTKAE